MTIADILNSFLKGEYPFPMLLLVVSIAMLASVLFSRYMLGKLNIATKTDITQLRGEITQLREETKADNAQLRGEIAQLREETKADNAQLREEMYSGLRQLKENDFYHTNKAILLMARALIPDQNIYGRIKDSVMENTPLGLREYMREI